MATSTAQSSSSAQGPAMVTPPPSGSHASDVDQILTRPSGRDRDQRLRKLLPLYARAGDRTSVLRILAGVDVLRGSDVTAVTQSKSLMRSRQNIFGELAATKKVKLSKASAIEMALRSPESLSAAIKTGAITPKTMPNLVTEVLSRGRGAKNLEKSLSILERAGFRVELKHLILATDCVPFDKLPMVLSKMKGLNSPSGAQALSGVLRQNPSLYRVLAAPGVPYLATLKKAMENANPGKDPVTMARAAKISQKLDRDLFPPAAKSISGREDVTPSFAR